MNFIKEKNRIILKNDNLEIIAEISFFETQKGIYTIDHTFVDESVRGKGIASKLVQNAVDEIRRRNGKVNATCSYAKKWLEKNNIEE